MVVRAATGEVVKVLPSPDKLDSGLRVAAFDGKRILVTDYLEYRVLPLECGRVSLFLGSFGIPLRALSGACSDGVNFWLALIDTAQLARF